MYNVALNKTLFQSGQAFLAALTGPLEMNNLPTGLTEQIQSLTAQAQTCWTSYEKGIEMGLDHQRVFGLAVRAVTLYTLACEALQPYYWVVRMEYYENQKDLMTAAHSQFASAATEMLERMLLTAGSLNKNTALSDENETATARKRLQYALHLIDLGLTLCRPKGYGNDSWHPNTPAWVAAKARTLRNEAAVSIAAARSLEIQTAEK